MKVFESKKEINLETPKNNFICSRAGSDYGIDLCVRKGDRRIPVARGEEIFSVYFPDGDVRSAKVKDVKVTDNNKIQLQSFFKGKDSQPWKVISEVISAGFEETFYFKQKISFEYQGDKNLKITALGCSFMLDTPPSFYWLVPGAQDLLSGDEHPCHTERNRFLRCVKNGRWNVRTALCATPLIYFYRQGFSYAVTTMPYYDGIMPGMDFRKKDGKIHAGVTYPYMEPTVHWSEDIAPGLICGPGSKFSWEVIHFLDSAETPHKYGDYLKVWYYLKGDNGDYNRWTSTPETLNLLKKGFLIHYDDKLAILHDALSYKDAVSRWPHRGMTNGWTSGAGPAFHMLKLGCHTGDEGLIAGATMVLDNISSSLAPSGFYCGEYDDIEKRWSPGLTWWETAMKKALDENMPGTKGYPGGKIPATPIAETTYYMLKSYELMKANGVRKEDYLNSASSNLTSLCKAAPDGVFGQFYEPDTGEVVREKTLLNNPESANMDWVAALSLGYKITGKKLYLETAEKAGDYFDKEFLSKIVILPSDCPCDSPSPMAESSNHALRGYWELYSATKEKKWLQCAIDAAHNALSWKIAYNMKMPADSEFEKFNFKSLGFDHTVSSHLYGCMNAVHFLHLWEETQDPYFLHRAVDTVQCSPQFIVRTDGEFGGKAGMLPEGLVHFKGRINRDSHISPIGWVTCANICCREEFGGIIVDYSRGEAGCIEFIDLREIKEKNNRLYLTLFNPWDKDILTTISVYFADKEITIIKDKKDEITPERAGNKWTGRIEVPSKRQTGIEIFCNIGDCPR